MLRRLVVLASVAIAARVDARPQSLPGWSRYEQLCAACHGTGGDGRGAAAPFLRDAPRDFTRGAFAWQSTPVGAPATLDDLALTIRAGVRDTAMPGFAAELGDAEVRELVAIVDAFAATPATARSRAVVLGVEPSANAARGAALWMQLGCASCHGATGRGDGPAAAALARGVYDLAAGLRRPRLADAPADRRRAAALDIASGLDDMPGYAGAISAADVWALADRAVELGAHDAQPAGASARPLGSAAVLAIATWPGSDPDEARIFGTAIPPQGAPPPSLAPAEASLSAAQCGRCHAKQLREWQPSLHAQAISPGYAARLADGANAAACARCHAPLPEQAGEQAGAAPLRAEGVQCAGCHVRGWTRRGPPAVAPTLLALPGYPFAPSPLYERADFCLPCHQLPPQTAVAGAPLLGTYEEWLAGPYMPRGIQCQSCHMSNREHQWLGVHDPATFRQGIRLTASARADADGIAIAAELANVGAGHDLPTTATPAVWLRLELVERATGRVAGSFAQRIGRDVVWDGAWHQRADTRIPPGQSLRVARVWRGARAEHLMARVTVEVHPDDYYERFYARRLAEGPPAAARALYAVALQRARGSHYIAETRAIALP